jgi:hypothetical protein
MIDKAEPSTGVPAGLGWSLPGAFWSLVPPPPQQDHEDSSEILKFRHPSLDRLTTNFAAVIRDNAMDRERR